MTHPPIVDVWTSGGEPMTLTTTHNGTETREHQELRHEITLAFLQHPSRFPPDPE